MFVVVNIKLLKITNFILKVKFDNRGSISLINFKELESLDLKPGLDTLLF